MNKNDSKLRWINVLSLVLLLAMSGNSATAAVLTVSDYTATNNTFTSLTIGGNIYSDLTGSTATVVADIGDLIYWMKGTTPAYTGGSSQGNTALSGLSYRDGVGNINVGSTFQFGRTITASDFIFLSDYGTGENVTFQLVDSTNTVLGTYSIAITAAQFGSGLIASTTYSTVYYSTGSPGDITSVQGAVAFQLADFVGTGDLSTATGIRLSAQGDGVDPSVVGLVAIPEPSSFLLLGLSGALLLLNRRQGSRFRLS